MQYRWVRTVMVMMAAVGLSACSGKSAAEMNPFREPNYGTDSNHGNRHAPLRNHTPYEDPMEQQSMMAPSVAPQPLVPPPSEAPYGYAAQPAYAQPGMDPYAQSAPAAMPMAAAPAQPMQAPAYAPPAPMQPPMQAQAPTQEDYYAMEMASSDYAQPQLMAPQTAPSQVSEYGVTGYSRPITESSAMGYDNGLYEPRAAVPSIPVNPKPSRLGYKILPDSRYAPRREAERWQR